MANNEVEKSISVIEDCDFKNNECDYNLLTASYRILRNYCASGKQAQVFLADHRVLLPKSKNLISFLLDNSRENGDLCLLVSLQFVANFIVDNRVNQNEVWATFSDVLQSALLYNEPKIQNCAAMIVYNVLLDNDELLFQIEEPLDHIIQLTQNDVTAEYAVFILELFVCKTMYISRQYRDLNDIHKAIVLNIIETVQKNPEGRKFPEGMLTFFAKYFNEKSHLILDAAVREMRANDAQEVAQILDIINSASGSNANSLAEVQMVDGLLVHAIGLLRAVHALSKENGNQFSMLLKLSDLESTERNDTLQEHPGFGFKAALVRLVGNMCWRHRGHQDTAREMGAIPLILDCCNIDARNPLIIQWAVLAMRNLCEDNLENQQVVASVDRRGQVDTSRLAQLGFCFNGGDNAG